MKKGIDYTGITVSYYCHDGKGNYVMHLRGEKCRDENGRWDCGGGSVKFGEKLDDAVRREIKEEFGADIISQKQIGVDEVFREHNGVKTHWIAFRFVVEVDPKTVYNAEPEKHDDLQWFRLDNLPSPLHSQFEKELEKSKKYLL